MSGAYLELIISLGLLLLGLYIFHNHLISHVARTRHKVPSAPDVTSPISLPYVWKLHQYLSGCLPLDILHQLTCRKTWGRRHKQMDVISRNMALQDLHLIRQTDLPNQFSDPNRHFLGQYRPSVFRDPYKMQLDVVTSMRRRSIKLHAAIILK
jgi:hypothetical protein